MKPGTGPCVNSARSPDRNASPEEADTSCPALFASRQWSRLLSSATGRSHVPVTSLEFSPDGRRLVSATGEVKHSGGVGSGDGSALLWPLPPPVERAIVALPSDHPARDALWAELSSSEASRAGAVLNR